jgi:AraC-like DNA-binding protein
MNAPSLPIHSRCPAPEEEPRVPANDGGEPEDFVARVHSAITVSLAHSDGRVETTARLLGVSSRTLQRRLWECRTSYQREIDVVRHRLAELLLSAPGTTVAEVARALGYGKDGAFLRAYRRWTGTTPRAVRPAPLESAELA